MTNTTTLPAIGDPFTFRTRSGYVLVQNRPLDCRDWGCRCGKCNGQVMAHSATVTSVIHWADNSIDVVGTDDAGVTHVTQVIAPHGDCC